MPWQELTPQETHDFIQLVKDDRLAALFDPHSCKVFTKDLPFYKNGILYSLENHCVAPPIFMDYIRSGHNGVYLDGSEKPFKLLNDKDCLILDHNTVIDYLEFYLSYVVEQPENTLLLKNPENMPFNSSFYIDFHFDKNNYSEKDIKIIDFCPENGFIISSPFVFNGKIDRGTAKIALNGDIMIEKERNSP